jgi:protein-L-isoaspartate(D-aspartate) O-methyltransferase
VPGAGEPLFKRYAVREDGTLLTQSTEPGLVRAVVGAADLAPGQHVLEVGTGSGYSTAVVARIVGPTGHVVSLDVNQALVERARDLLHADGLVQVEVQCQDARAGLPGGAPFDRVIAWATSPSVPGAWLASAREGGLLVLPVAIAPLLGATAVARVRRAGASPHVEWLLRGGFVPLHGPTAVGLPDLPDLADLAWSEGDDGDWSTTAWLSAAWLRPRSPAQLVAMRRLVHHLAPATPLLLAGESPEAFALFVSVTRPDAVVVQAPAIGRAVGVGSRDGLAVQALGGNVLLTTSEDAAARLREVVQAWRAAGCPDLPDYRPRLRQHGADWLVRLSVP